MKNIKYAVLALCVLTVSVFTLSHLIARAQTNQKVKTIPITGGYLPHIRSSSTDLFYVDFVGQQIPHIVRLGANAEPDIWTPPLSSRTIWSISPGGQSHFFVAYKPFTQEASQSKMIIAAATFGATTLDVLWQSSQLIFRRFFVTESGAIYGVGYNKDQVDNLERRSRTLQAEKISDICIVHIVDSSSGKELHLFPITISSRNPRIIDSLAASAVLSVRSNGNFFLLFNPLQMKAYGWKQFVTKTAIEYSSKGEIIKSWDLGISDIDGAFVNNIFLTQDDRIIAEILVGKDERRVNIGGQDTTLVTFENHYLVRVDQDGHISRSITPPVFNNQVVAYLAGTDEFATFDSQTSSIQVVPMPFDSASTR